MTTPRKDPFAGGPLRLQRGLSVLATLGPKGRIFVLCLFFVVLLGIWFGLRNYAENWEKGRDADHPPTKVLGPAGFPFEIEGVPTLDPSQAAAIRDATPEEQRKASDEALAYVMLETLQAPAVAAFDTNLMPLVPGLAEQIRQDPAPHRFKFYRFRGKLESIEEKFEQGEGANRAMAHYHRGTILVDPGDPPLRITFFTPFPPRHQDEQLPVVSPPMELITDGFVRGRGIFLQRYLDLDPASRETPTLLIVATLLERDYEARPVETLADVGLDAIRDDKSLWGSPDEPLLRRPYTLSLLRFVKYAEPRAGEAGRARREAEKLVPEGFDSPEGYDALTRDPREHRAKYYAGLGALIDTPFVQDLDGDVRVEANDAGVERYATGLIYTDNRFIVSYAAPASIVKGLRKGARIRYEGYFYKNRLYPSKSGAYQLVPWLVLTELREILPEPPNVIGQLVFAGAFVFVIGAVIFWVVREDRTKEDFRARRRRRIAEARPDEGA